MKSKVNCGRLLKAIFYLQEKGLRVTAYYGYNSRNTVPINITIHGNVNQILSRAMLDGITNNGFNFSSVKIESGGGFVYQVVRGTA